MSKPHQYLHERVSDSLRQRVAGGELGTGDLLPSEQILSQEFGVSRSVVRQAIRNLANEGVLQLVSGRGAVVTGGGQWHRDAQTIAGLSSQMNALGLRVTTSVRQLRVVEHSARSGALGTEQALYLERVRALDGAPLALIRTWLPPRLADGLTRENLTDASLHTRMAELGFNVYGGRREIRAVAATTAIASSLQVDSGAPVLLLEGESVDTSGAVCEVFSTWHRSDRIALDVSVGGRTVRQPSLDEASDLADELSRMLHGLKGT